MWPNYLFPALQSKYFDQNGARLDCNRCFRFSVSLTVIVSDGPPIRAGAVSLPVLWWTGLAGLVNRWLVNADWANEAAV